MIKKVLIVDDEPDIRALLEITLSRMQIETRAAENITQAKQLLSEESFSLVLTDMNMPDGNGIDLVAHIQKQSSNTPVAVITAYGSIDTAISALKAGAFDFVSKPVDLARLRELVNSALKLPKSDTPKAAPQVTQLLGESSTMDKLRGQIRKLARSQAPIYISGESGSGKEMVAKSIHEQGPRSEGPFVPVNCGAIPSELMESEFFGHKKGAFTGAVENKVGLFQAANGGTLFLDEVADLPLTMQVKLLRAIQEKAVRPVGEQKEIPIDVRILSATHKDLHNEVDEGRFRQDLFYRINVIELRVPSLRQRKEDIPLLANHFLKQLADECEIPDASISKAAMQKLEAYYFPGNVRELENIMERAFTLCEDDVINEEDIHLPKTDTEGSSTDAMELDVPEFDENKVNLEHFLENIEKQAIEKALEETRWNKTAAAKKLGISFRALRYRLKKLGME
ncbi:sigma-54-dependent transcriptional regulator [Hahella sp. CR1]|uniref:sigma-54-dependent transcriptional regulator n=1 Tax=unclassified Hahella TaxID=2624107 RepID=UPI002441E7B6|nr:sigma-54 dependent transcriptional regulator [Hahella sp. CR1]MDG9670395.1 sigma-54 dependent transcriptional regulator [Hahella sp. CR1]